MVKVLQNYTIPKVADVNEYLLYKPRVFKTELCVIMGAGCATGELTNAAIQLYEQELFSKIAMTGGMGVSQCKSASALNQEANSDLNHNTEAECMEDLIVTALGAEKAKEVIVSIDNKARNTQENIINLKDILSSVASITFVTLAYHQRRVIGTARKNLGFLQPMTAHPVFPFGITRENWHELPAVKEIVLSEYHKMTPHHPESYINKYCLNISDFGEVRRP